MVIQELVDQINEGLKGSRELIVRGYTGSDSIKRDEHVRLHGADWYGQLVQETITWLTGLLKDKKDQGWAAIGGYSGEAKAAVERALESLRVKTASHNAADSKWKPACEGPAGAVLQTLSSKPGSLYLRNVSRVSQSKLAASVGTPATMLQRVWPLAAYNVMLRLGEGNFDRLEVVKG